MQKNRINVGKLFSKSDLERFIEEYALILKLFEGDDLSNIQNRLNDKEMYKNQYFIDNFQDIIKPLKKNIDKYSKLYLKDLKLSEYDLKDIYETIDRNKLTADVRNNLTHKTMKDFTFNDLKITDFSIVKVDENELVIWGLKSNQLTLMRFQVSFIYTYNNSANVIFVKLPLSHYLVDYAISFTECGNNCYKDVKAYFLVKYHHFDTVGNAKENEIFKKESEKKVKHEKLAKREEASKEKLKEKFK